MAQRILMKRCLIQTTRCRSMTLISSSSPNPVVGINAAIGRNFHTYQVSGNAPAPAPAPTPTHIHAQQRYKSFQSTQPLYNDTKEATTAAAVEESKKENDDEDDPIPNYQNPLHHNDPNNQKVLFEDFDTNNETPEIVPLPPFDDGTAPNQTIADPKLHGLADEMLLLNMYEMKELVDRIADHFDIEEGDDDHLIPGGGGADGAGGDQDEPKVEKTAFDLKLTAFDAKSKIKVIKEVRAMTGLGLKDAKALVEGAPKTVKTDIKMEEAEELKAKLEAVGATVEIE